MNELQAALKIALANTFVMYFKSHSFHWNVEGPNFQQYHSFFNDLYEELHDAVDPIAEHIRTLDAYAPVSLSDLYDAKTVMDESTLITDGKQMFASLLLANDTVIESLNKAFQLATYNNKQGLCNFLADRLDIHAKHAWQIKSHLKG